MDKEFKAYVLGIDPGTTLTGVCLVRTEDRKPLAFAKIENEHFEDWFVRAITNNGVLISDIEIVIERMQGGYGMVGAETFLTCEWIGRFDTILTRIWKVEKVSYILRSQEYKYLCGRLYKHNDVGVRQALTDMFAYGQPNFGKGTKKEPGWFYGFSKDVWSGYAIAISHIGI